MAFEHCHGENDSQQQRQYADVGIDIRANPPAASEGKEITILTQKPKNGGRRKAKSAAAEAEGGSDKMERKAAGKRRMLKHY